MKERMKRYDNLLLAVETAAAVNTPSKPFRLLEIGVWHAGNALAMVRRANAAGRRNVEYYGFDLFASLYGRLTAEEKGRALSKSRPPLTVAAVHARLAPHCTRVTLYEGDTRVRLPAAVPTLPPMDVIFIDGDHSLAGVAADWAQCRRLMAAHTPVLFDDYFPDRLDVGARALVDSLAADPAYAVRLLEPVDRPASTGLVIQMAEVRRKGTP